MAEIVPEFNRERDGVTVVKWAAVSDGDTMQPITMEFGGGLACEFQIDGTPGGTTVQLHGAAEDVSTKYGALTDTVGAEIALDEDNKVQQISVASKHLKPVLVDGSGITLDVYLTLRS